MMATSLSAREKRRIRERRVVRILTAIKKYLSCSIA